VQLSSPEIKRMSVDFPAPETPKIPKISPPEASKLTSRKTQLSSYLLARFVTFKDIILEIETFAGFVRANKSMLLSSD
jgi:hypothetical protein